jgi:hypothetical protein
MRAALVGVLALGLAGGAGASRPVLRLSDGQTRWFLPSQLRTGDRIRCDVHGQTIGAVVPSPPSAARTSGSDTWKAGGAQLEIEKRATGATQVTCGAGAPPSRRPQLPYVIGQNGLGLIRGPNTLRELERLYGRGSRRNELGGCGVTWPALGLKATFGGARCSDGSTLRTATVGDARWTSLNGVHVGDPIARMQWQVPTAKRLQAFRRRAVWLLATGVHGSLSAGSGASGTVTSLSCVAR